MLKKFYHSGTLIVILRAARLTGKSASLRTGAKACRHTSGGRDLAIVPATSSATRATCKNIIITIIIMIIIIIKIIIVIIIIRVDFSL